MTEITFVCCFCGKGEADHGLPLVDMDGEFKQQWWCHLECFKEKLHESSRHFAEWGDDDEWEVEDADPDS